MSVKYRFVLALLSLALGACTALPSPRERQDHADNLAAARQWQKGTLTAAPFTLRTYEPVTPRQGDTLAVYIEGDGLAWLNPSQPSADPTPVSPLLLQLALAQREGKAAYLARPCQYAEPGAAPCAQRYWTDGRFAPEVIDAMDRALDQLKDTPGGPHPGAGGLLGRRRRCRPAGGPPQRRDPPSDHRRQSGPPGMDHLPPADRPSIPPSTRPTGRSGLPPSPRSTGSAAGTR